MTQTFPLLPLRDIVVFPGMVVPLFVGRDKSVAALEAAMEGSKDIFLLAQLDPSCEETGGSDLYDVGVIAQILQMLKMPDGTVRVLVEGTSRAQLSELQDEGAVTFAQVRPMEQATVSGSEVTALMRTVIEQFADYAKLSKKNEGAAEELGEIDDAADIGQPTLSQQLAVLRNAGLVTTRKDAKLVFYRIDEGRLGAISTALGALAGIDRAPPPPAPRKAPGVANFARLG